jgi:hypothetical protein
MPSRLERSLKELRSNCCVCEFCLVLSVIFILFVFQLIFWIFLNFFCWRFFIWILIYEFLRPLLLKLFICVFIWFCTSLWNFMLLFFRVIHATHMFDKMSQWILINKSITRFVVFCVPSLFINDFISYEFKSINSHAVELDLWTWSTIIVVTLLQ